MFRLYRTAGPFGDATAAYRVDFSVSQPTVKDFVDHILTKRESDWGYIGIHNESVAWFEGGTPKIEYRWGNLNSGFTEETLNRKIQSAIANGGWSRMDYVLTLSD